MKIGWEWEKNINFVPQIMVHVTHIQNFNLRYQKHNFHYQLDFLFGTKLQMNKTIGTIFAIYPKIKLKILHYTL